jgi:hypothetical protein
MSSQGPSNTTTKCAAASDPHTSNPHASDAHASDAHASDTHASDAHASDTHASDAAGFPANTNARSFIDVRLRPDRIYTNFHMHDIFNVTSLTDARVVFSFLNDLLYSMDDNKYISFSDSTIEYIINLCKTYPEEYVQNSTLELFCYALGNNILRDLNKDSSLFRWLVDLTKECDPKTTVSMNMWNIIACSEPSRNVFLELCQQDNKFVEAFLYIAQRQLDASLIYWTILRSMPESVDIIKTFWPFVTKDEKIISFEDFITELKQMNTDDERPTKSAANKRPQSELPLPPAKRRCV